ncbi:SRPBCC family protein [Limisalsivibrio acetivorans]|uniref:SRPBCC family protein n=1 Tax=Limisalsivibrio acetivorans TaxID=1304888 RepID=UPI0003B78245|nr:SRPBCC family protein [Limisalsivibrio acetivorans]
MRINTIERTQLIGTDIESAWDFFSDPSKLAEITPDWLNFRVVSPLAPRMYEGMIVEYRIKPFAGVSVQWVTEITHVDEPGFFVDEQRFGPYKFWHHKHFFEETENGVLMSDSVHYSLGFGPAGSLIHHFYVRKKLEEIFDYRYEKLERIFG